MGVVKNSLTLNGKFMKRRFQTWISTRLASLEKEAVIRREEEMGRSSSTILLEQLGSYSVRLQWLPRIAKNLPGALLLLVVPAVFLFVTVQLTRVSGPQWLGENFENSYPYLFNSLLLVTKQIPAWIYHPGTFPHF